MKNLIQSWLKLKVGHKVNMAAGYYFFFKHNVVNLNSSHPGVFNETETKARNNLFMVPLFYTFIKHI